MKLFKSQEDKDKENFYKLLKRTREAIPERYNHIELLDGLLDESVDWFVSISNRSDGKSFNYINFFCRLAIEFDLKFMLVARHYTIQNAYVTFIIELFEQMDDLDATSLSIRRTDDYIVINYGRQELCIITDLNNATDLKYYSNYLKQFPIMVYDEFLAIESDYLPDEWEKLKAIYESVDRNHGDVPLIGSPKIFLLGNAVNFSSPLLANLDLFNRLENHPMNAMKQYGHILLELRRNDNVNDLRNTRAFKSDDDAMTTAQFSFNNTYIANQAQRGIIKSNARVFYVKLERHMLKVTYDIETKKSMLSIEVDKGQKYDFCTHAKDFKKGVRFVKESWYRENHPDKYIKGQYLFDNAFSKEFIVKDKTLSRLYVQKLIKLHRMANREKPIDKEEIFVDNYMERTKRAIARKFESM